MHEKSKCKKGWLHRYKFTRIVTGVGIEEVCEICKDRKFFKNEIPNHIYLSYHNRQALSREHNLFKHEYAPTATAN